MSKKDKKIEIQLADAKVAINNANVDGYNLTAGKKVIGEIAELDNKFAVVKNGEVEALFKTLEQAIESIIEYDTSLLTYEPMNKHLNFSLTCVVIYTNLTYEDEEGLDAYDALVSSGLLDKIIEMIGVDYGDMVAMFEETLSARISFTNSMSNRLSALFGILENVFKEATPEQLDYLRKLADVKDGDNSTVKKAD